MVFKFARASDYLFHFDNPDKCKHIEINTLDELIEFMKNTSDNKIVLGEEDGCNYIIDYDSYLE